MRSLVWQRRYESARGLTQRTSWVRFPAAYDRRMRRSQRIWRTWRRILHAEVNADRAARRAR